ncbi:MAG: hypothetical protein CMF48_01085 [Legionellales bacterium]|nr:hypothetical protein [Legionellales bacterium]
MRDKNQREFAAVFLWGVLTAIIVAFAIGVFKGVQGIREICQNRRNNPAPARAPAQEEPLPKANPNQEGPPDTRTVSLSTKLENVIVHRSDDGENDEDQASEATPLLYGVRAQLAGGSDAIYVPEKHPSYVPPTSKSSLSRSCP